MVQTDVWTTRSAPTGVAARVVPHLRRCKSCGMLCEGGPHGLAPYCSPECHEAHDPQDFYLYDDDDGG
jgi:hypothetical protein